MIVAKNFSLLKKATFSIHFVLVRNLCDFMKFLFHVNAFSFVGKGDVRNQEYSYC